MAKKEDSLFLLEVLIDKVVFTKSPCFTDKDFRTCVNIQCTTVESLEICDDEQGTNVPKSEGPFTRTFNSGKSCLFSLKESEIHEAMNKFPIKVSVYRSLPCGCLPTKVVLGEATIDMTKEFVQARNKFLEDPNSVSYQALKDSFRIVDKDGVEAGEIVMFLRISCFGKLIVTKFQGTGGTPNLKSGGASAPVDRSCVPRRDYQTPQDPCVCGATRRLGAADRIGKSDGPPCSMSEPNRLGVCPTARDPYNSMPCEEFDDPCYCSGPKPASEQRMSCRNTDKYCLHVPKGTLLHSHFGQESLKVVSAEIRSSVDPPVLDLYQQHLQLELGREITAREVDYKNSQWLTDSSDMSFLNDGTTPVPGTADLFSNSSTCTISPVRSRQRSVSFSETVDYFWKLHNKSIKFSSNDLDITSSIENRIFGKNETTVYMTLFEESGHLKNSGTQATGSINKCLQIRSNKIYSSSFQKSSYNNDSNTNLLYRNSKSGIQNSIYNPEIYFCGRKCKSKKGMGSQHSGTQLRDTATSKSSKKDIGRSGKATSTQAKSTFSSATMQTKKTKQISSGTGTPKTVSIKAEEQKPCPAIGTIKGDMMVTLSHIKICPKQPCPTHGRDPCQGPRCIEAASQEGEQAPVKVTNVNNPRRGVFELVIRKMTGAPLATNELMLEWTPPTCRTPTCTNCSGPWPPMVCRRPSCRISRYKLLACRPIPSRPKCSVPCRQKCLKKLCKRSCCQMCLLKCPPTPCKKCRKPSCCGRSCSRPCLPEPCKHKSSTCPKCCTSPSIPSTCKSPCPPSCPPPCLPAPCYINPCTSPCFSTPCLRPCPVGRKRPRRARSHPRIKQHKKRISPCLNKSKLCPLVRCRSTFMPCDTCCSLKYCYPRKVCLSPCKSLGFCKSCCSTNCE